MARKDTGTDTVSCDCCNSVDCECVTHKRGYTILKCRQCGLFFVSPQPSPHVIDDQYDRHAGYFATASKDLSQTDPDKAIKLDRLYSELGVNRGRFLDVGCSSGKLLYNMKRLGWQVTGNDINVGALEIAEGHGLEVFHAPLEECHFNENTFDAIHLGDLIEHVRSPRGLMKEVFRILRPGGIVTIITPNAKCGFATASLLLSRITGMSWAHSEAPYHLYDFSPKNLVQLLNNLGYELCTIVYKGGATFAYTVGSTGYFDELKRDMKKTGRYSLTSGFLLELPKLVAVTALLAPLWVWGKTVNRIHAIGGSMLVAARRPDDAP